VDLLKVSFGVSFAKGHQRGSSALKIKEKGGAMKKTLLLVAGLGIMGILLLPQISLAETVKSGKAVSSVKSKGATSNSIKIQNGQVSNRLFSALTESVGETETFASLEGSGPAALSAAAAGAGSSVAKGRNKGKAGNFSLPVIKGISQSGIAVDSASAVSLD